MSEVEVYLAIFGHCGMKKVEVMTVFGDYITNIFITNNIISSKAPYIGKTLVSRHKCSATGLSMCQAQNRNYFSK